MNGSWAVVLRSVAITIPATGLLYEAADMLTPGRNTDQRATNRTVVQLTQRLLCLPDISPEVVEHVLRNLPEEPVSRNQER